VTPARGGVTRKLFAQLRRFVLVEISLAMREVRTTKFYGYFLRTSIARGGFRPPEPARDRNDRHEMCVDLVGLSTVE
jgi:hypothetical protein